MLAGDAGSVLWHDTCIVILWCGDDFVIARSLLESRCSYVLR